MHETDTPSAIANDGRVGSLDPGPSWSAQAGDQALRVVVLLAGLGLLVGFFLPWLRLGDFAEMSGLSLMVSSGSAVDALAGPASGLLIMIPACGAGLIACSAFGPRASVIAALIAGVAILGFGLVTLARVFLQTMGSGMWIVAGSALLAVGAGIAGIAGRRSAD